MARPIYIVCARSSSQDRASGLLSLFELIEKYQIFPIDLTKRDGPIIIPAQPLRLVATWMIEPDKGERFGDPFEFEFRLVVPPEPKVHRLGGGSFLFEESQPLHRFTLQIDAPLPLEGPGVMWAESLVRKAGEDEWTIQSYPILLEEGLTSSPALPSPAILSPAILSPALPSPALPSPTLPSPPPAKGGRKRKPKT
jgi:hypothetical protein